MPEQRSGWSIRGAVLALAIVVMLGFFVEENFLVASRHHTCPGLNDAQLDAVYAAAIAQVSSQCSAAAARQCHEGFFSSVKGLLGGKLTAPSPSPVTPLHSPKASLPPPPPPPPPPHQLVAGGENLMDCDKLRNQSVAECDQLRARLALKLPIASSSNGSGSPATQHNIIQRGLIEDKKRLNELQALQAHSQCFCFDLCDDKSAGEFWDSTRGAQITDTGSPWLSYFNAVYAGPVPLPFPLHQIDFFYHQSPTWRKLFPQAANPFRPCVFDDDGVKKCDAAECAKWTWTTQSSGTKKDALPPSCTGTANEGKHTGKECGASWGGMTQVQSLSPHLSFHNPSTSPTLYVNYAR